MWGQMNDEAAVLRRALSESSKLGPSQVTWSTAGAVSTTPAVECTLEIRRLSYSRLTEQLQVLELSSYRLIELKHPRRHASDSRVSILERKQEKLRKRD